jgi:hypothetical protein
MDDFSAKPGVPNNLYGPTGTEAKRMRTKKKNAEFI